MTTDNSEKEYRKHTCGECARFKVPDSGCWYAEDIRQGIMGKSDSACEQFFLAKKAKETKVRKQLKDSGTIADGPFEAIYHNGKPCFLIRTGDSFNVRETLETEEQVLYSKEAKQIPYEPYGYFSGVVLNREDLFWKVYQEIKTFIDVENIWKDVLSACVLLSYHQEKLQTVPYIFLYGDNESGKSTVLQILKFLCYRPMYGVTVPSADVYGYLEDSDGIGCILEDEVQGIQKDTDKIKIYKAGYKQGAVVPRTIMLEHDRVIKFYKTFCLKACASEQIPQVKGFRERFLEIPMVEGVPDKEWADITEEDLGRLRNLRNMLLKWRLLSRDWKLPNVELSVKGRLKELWMPILEITHGLTAYDGLCKFVEDQKKERLSTKQDTLEGKIVKVVTEILNEAEGDSFNIPFQIIWNNLAEELDGKIDDKKPHVMETSEFFQVTKNKVGYRLREVLSGKSKAIRERDLEGDKIVKAYDFNPEKLRRVAKKYGYELVTKLPKLPSSEDTQAPKSMEKPEENNVEKGFGTSQQLDKLSYIVTTEEKPSEPSSIPSKNLKEKSTGGKSGPKSFTAQEVFDKVRSILIEGTEEEWIKHFVEAGLSEKDAEDLFESLRGSELFWFERDEKSFYRWIEGPTPEQVKAYREMQQDNWNFFEKDSKKKEEKPL
jgi:hypothetical protein